VSNILYWLILDFYFYFYFILFYFIFIFIFLYFSFILFFLSLFLAFRPAFQGCLIFAGRGASTPARKKASD